MILYEIDKLSNIHLNGVFRDLESRQKSHKRGQGVGMRVVGFETLLFYSRGLSAGLFHF